MTTYSLPCPNGCAQTIAARGDDIHACAASAYDEYLACHDGAIIARARNNSDAALALATYTRLIEPEDDNRPEPIREPLDQERSGVGEPEEDDEEFAGPAYHAPGYCANCGGPHHVQRCGEIAAALRVAPIPAVRTTARQWLTDDWRRDALARQWSEALRQQMDASAESYAGMQKARS